MLRIAGVGANALVDSKLTNELNIHHARAVVAYSDQPAPNDPDRIQVANVAAYALESLADRAVLSLHHTRAVTARVDKYTLDMRLTEHESFHRLLLTQWDSLEELLHVDGFTITEVRDNPDGYHMGADTVASIAFTETAPGIGDMEFTYDRIQSITINDRVVDVESDPSFLHAYVVNRWPALADVTWSYDSDTNSITVTQDSVLWAVGSVITFTMPPQYIPDDDLYASNVIGLNPIHYWPIYADSADVVTDFGSRSIDGDIHSPGLTSTTDPVRKYVDSSLGFNISRAGQSRVIIPTDDVIRRHMDINTDATIVLWVRSDISISQDMPLACYSNAGRGYGPYRLWDSNAEFSDNKNRLIIPGYVRGGGVPTFIGWRRRSDNTFSVFSNGVWNTDMLLVDDTVPFQQGGTLEFPGCFNYSHYGIRGVVSDVAFFDRALSDKEIEDLYNLGKLDDE